MGERYRIKIRIIELVSSRDRWYMGCRDCWKKLSNEDNYKCPRCPMSVPLPRCRVLLNAVDVDAADVTVAPMAKFTFFGTQGEVIAGKEAVIMVANARGQANYVPPELTTLIGQKFIVTVTPHNKSLDADYMHCQVQATEPLHEETPSEQAPAAGVLNQLVPSKSTPARTDSGATSTPPLPADTTPQSDVLSTPQSIEKSVSTKDTCKRTAQQTKQEHQKRGRTARELKYPSEE